MESMNQTVHQSIQNYSQGKPVLIFTSSRRQTRLTASALVAFSASNDTNNNWCFIDQDELSYTIAQVADESLKTFIPFGIGIHHAGLEERDRRIVEELFSQNKIHVLIATSTLAWGVNFPAHLVIIKGTEYYDGKTHSYIDFPITDILQMMGRAGRPQFDNTGIAVILVHETKKNFYKKFLYEPFPVESSIFSALPDHLNAEIASKSIKTITDAHRYLKHTFGSRRLSKNPSYYLKETLSSKRDIQKFTTQIVIEAIQTLVNAGCVWFKDEDLEPTILGEITSHYYLSHKTIKMFNEKLNEHCTVNDLLIILSDSFEFEKVPVRHNEDSYNESLAKIVPLCHHNNDYSSPHVKTFLLLQAHVSRTQLPIKDYYTDSKSVIDQALRLIQAMIDVCSLKLSLKSTLQCIILMQSIIQACWWHKSSLYTLPFINSDFYQFFQETATSVLKQDVVSIAQFVGTTYSVLNSLKQSLSVSINSKNLLSIFSFIESLPNISIQWLLMTDDNNILAKSKEFENYSDSCYQQKYIECAVGIDIKIIVSLKSQFMKNTASYKIYHSRIGKEVDESWILLIGEKERDRLITLKRISPIRFSTKLSLLIGKFDVQDIGTTRIITLYFMSECLMGLDQQINIPILITDR
ncbi:hypothetical protein MXB_1979 [Myxobolus squamalis]|nr:hypothetical protein MXB_1979 [Myxobolus squamalis]